MYLCVFSVRDPDAFALILCEYYLSMIISGKRTHKIRRLDPDLRKSRYWVFSTIEWRYYFFCGAACCKYHEIQRKVNKLENKALRRNEIKISIARNMHGLPKFRGYSNTNQQQSFLNSQL